MPRDSASLTNAESSSAFDKLRYPSGKCVLPHRGIDIAERSRSGRVRDLELHGGFVPGDVVPRAELEPDPGIHADQLEAHQFVEPHAARVWQRDAGAGLEK